MGLLSASRCVHMHVYTIILCLFQLIYMTFVLLYILAGEDSDSQVSFVSTCVQSHRRTCWSQDLSFPPNQAQQWLGLGRVEDGDQWSDKTSHTVCSCGVSRTAKKHSSMLWIESWRSMEGEQGLSLPRGQRPHNEAGQAKEPQRCPWRLQPKSVERLKGSSDGTSISSPHRIGNTATKKSPSKENMKSECHRHVYQYSVCVLIIT